MHECRKAGKLLPAEIAAAGQSDNLRNLSQLPLLLLRIGVKASYLT